MFSLWNKNPRKNPLWNWAQSSNFQLTLSLLLINFTSHSWLDWGASNDFQEFDPDQQSLKLILSSFGFKIIHYSQIGSGIKLVSLERFFKIDQIMILCWSFVLCLLRKKNQTHAKLAPSLGQSGMELSPSYTEFSLRAPTFETTKRRGLLQSKF